jgi:hypothetical protein
MAHKKDRYVAPLPNMGSTGQTPASLAIDIHYAKLLLVERWTWERFVRLCHFLKMTSCEVASLVLLPHRHMAEYQRRNTLPLLRPHAASVALSLTLLEAYLMRGLTDDVVPNAFPDLNVVTPSGVAGREAEGFHPLDRQAEVAP